MDLYCHDTLVELTIHLEATHESSAPLCLSQGENLVWKIVVGQSYNDLTYICSSRNISVDADVMLGK